jgi:hypothetical protein
MFLSILIDIKKIVPRFFLSIVYVILCIFTTYVQHIFTQHYTFYINIKIQHKVILCIFIFTMSDRSLLMGFSIPIKVVQLLIFFQQQILQTTNRYI